KASTFARWSRSAPTACTRPCTSCRFSPRCSRSCCSPRRAPPRKMSRTFRRGWCRRHRSARSALWQLARLERAEQRRDIDEESSARDVLDARQRVAPRIPEVARLEALENRQVDVELRHAQQPETGTLPARG